MKKNLFLLFSIYFFVVQPLIVWILRGQTNFFRLGAINLIAILLIWSLYIHTESVTEQEKTIEKKTIHESQVSFHEHFRTPHKEHKKRSELAIPSLLSYVVIIVMFFILHQNIQSSEIVLFIALSLGFIVFLSITYILKHRITKSFLQLFGTKIYIILFSISIFFVAYDYYNTYQIYQSSISEYLSQNILGQEILPNDTYVFTGEWTIVGSGIWTTTGSIIGEEIASDIFSGMTTGTDIQETTGTVLWTSETISLEPNSTDTVTTIFGKQKLMDAVIYLVKKYDIDLITKKDINFTYVTTQNPYYAEWRTAYDNKLIGKTTNPSKYIVCESYIVMKWLLEKRPVVYTSSNVLAKFRAEAEQRNALNGCIKGNIVTDNTL